MLMNHYRTSLAHGEVTMDIACRGHAGPPSPASSIPALLRSARQWLPWSRLLCRKHGVLSSTEMNVSLRVWNHQKLELVRVWMKWSQVSMLRNCNTSIPRIFGILDTCQVVSHTVKDTENRPFPMTDFSDFLRRFHSAPRFSNLLPQTLQFLRKWVYFSKWTSIWGHSSEVQMMHIG